ncbi:MAG: hypothetical protein KF824_07865 [Fimbriimonadaceae bacterium]|nr:MAG: hypothetical protein KF824_07865 [Fimbriimonadaceae bacterium]
MLTSLVLGLSLQISKRIALLENSARKLNEVGFNCQVSTVDDPQGEIWCELSTQPKKGMLAHLNHIRGLTSLRVFHDSLTDMMVFELKNLPDLTLLVLMSKQLTDQCTVPVSKLTGLKKLDLNKAKLSRQGIKRIADLKKLERLYLYNSQIKDEDLKPLGQMSQLKVLSLPKNVGDAIMSDLLNALPNTKITRD